MFFCLGEVRCGNKIPCRYIADIMFPMATSRMFPMAIKDVPNGEFSDSRHFNWNH